MGGLMSVTGERDDQPGGGPQKVGVALADILTGMYATVGVLAVLAHRDRTGLGQHIDLALLDVQLACLANQAMNYLTSGTPPRRMGNAHPNIVPYQTFATADGHVIVAVGNDRQFARFCELLDRPDLSQDPRFTTNARRVQHRAELIPLIEEIMAERDSDAWLADLEHAGIPNGPINSLDNVFANPQLQHRGMRVELAHGTAGRVPLVASPLRLSATPVEYQRPPPALGEHTAAVLGELLGKNAESLIELRAKGVI
jgi:crotonobetainyl-CoA:carnitine CoA-transferase CaiB-like acyl-CoA transferase